MSALPKDWGATHLRSVAEFRNGINYTKDNLGSGIKVIGVGNFRGNFCVPYSELEEINPEGVVRASDLLEKGDIVFVRSNGNPELVGQCLFVEHYPTPITHSGFTIRLRFLDDQAFPLFYAHYFRSNAMRRALALQRRGTNITNLSQSILGELQIPLPPLLEQRKIAEVLSTWDAAIGLVEQMIAAVQRRKRGLMQRLLLGSLRFPKFEGQEWNHFRLGDILTSRDERSEQTEGLELYSLTIEDGVTPKTERYDRGFLVKSKDKQYKKVYPHDIVYNPSNLRWGAIALSSVARVVLVSPVYEVLYLKTPENVSPLFLAELLSSSRQINLFAQRAEGTLVERMAVKLPDFLSSMVSLPHLVEQKKVSQVLNACSEELQILRRWKDGMCRQKEGLMQRLLTGQIRVQVDKLGL